MAEVTGLTAAKMQAIADASVVSGTVDGTGHLKLTTSGGSVIDAGDVIGPEGPIGPTGPTAPAPSGSIIMFASVSPPSGWLLCNGAAKSRTTYATLFGVIGTTYGPGDGSTTFNVPDMRSRFPRHDTNNMGDSGGSDTHAHTHTVSSHAHSLSNGNPTGMARITMNSGQILMEKVNGANGWTADTDTNTGGPNNENTSGLTSGAKVVGNSDNSGGGKTGSDNTDNMPSYLNVAFIIKT